VSEFVKVYSAEMRRRIRCRAFLLGLFFGTLGLFALIRAPQFIGATYQTQARALILAGDPALVSRAKKLLANDFSIVGTLSATTRPTAQLLASHHHAKALLLLARSSSGLRVRIYAEDPGDFDSNDIVHDLLPLRLQTALSASPARAASIASIPLVVRPISAKFRNAEQSNSARVIAYIMLFVLYFLILINSQMIMTSIAEEKTSRIAELLVASVNPMALLWGKIGASATLALLQLAIWIGVGFLAGNNPAASAAARPRPSRGLLKGPVQGENPGRPPLRPPRAGPVRAMTAPRRTAPRRPGRRARRGPAPARRPAQR